MDFGSFFPLFLPHFFYFLHNLIFLSIFLKVIHSYNLDNINFYVVDVFAYPNFLNIYDEIISGKNNKKKDSHA